MKLYGCVEVIPKYGKCHESCAYYNNECSAQSKIYARKLKLDGIISLCKKRNIHVDMSHHGGCVEINGIYIYSILSGKWCVKPNYKWSRSKSFESFLEKMK